MFEELFLFVKSPVYTKDPNEQLQYRCIRIAKLLVLSIGLSLVLLTVASTLQTLFKIEIGKHAIDDLFENNSPIIILLLAVIVAPVLEELIFRAPLKWFRSSPYFRIIFYVFAICFGVVHLTNFEITPQVLALAPVLVAPQISIGILLGFVRVRFGLLWSITMHGLYNLILIGPLLVLRILEIPIE